MTFSIVHLSDPHFGEEADLPKVDAIAALVPDLEPNLIVVSGDLTVRARHGEFQAARGWIHDLERTAPVYIIPGNHDVQWWRAPLLWPLAELMYAKYTRYFGPVLTPTFQFDDAVVAGALTAHGIAWGSLTHRPRDLTITGHLPKSEIARVTEIFRRSLPDQLRVLVLHHNVLRGEVSGRMGLTRWKQVHQLVMQSGAELVLCGHDHQDKAEVMGGVVVSCAGTLSTRLRGDEPATFHRIAVEDDGIQVELYKWETNRGRFRRTDVHAFARKRVLDDAHASTVGVV